MSSSPFSNQFELPAYDLSPQKVTKFLLSLIAVLVFFNLTERVIVHWLNATNGTNLISHYFNFDQEFNFPSLYSALALGFCSYLLKIVANLRSFKQGKYVQHWKALSLIFLYLALDEACSVHELLIPIFRSAMNAKGILYFTWVVPAFFLLIIFLLAFRKFIFHLPAKIKTLFVLAGTVYVLGALGMELVGGYIADNFGYGTIYGVASSVEELLEMLGIVIFINGLLSYIQSHQKQLHFSVLFESPNNRTINH